MKFRFKSENKFLDNLGKESYFSPGNMLTLRYCLFTFFILLNLVDDWNWNFTWEDLSTKRTVVLGDAGKYCKSILCRVKNLFKTYFIIYLYFILEVGQQSCECIEDL